MYRVLNIILLENFWIQMRRIKYYLRKTNIFVLGQKQRKTMSPSAACRLFLSIIIFAQMCSITDLAVCREYRQFEIKKKRKKKHLLY